MPTSPDGTVRARGLWKRFRADRPDRLLRAHLVNLRPRDRSRREDAWRWVLQDIDLDALPGESIGLVGANGSGKTTLLKLLTRVMYPYAGTIDIAGRVGALIEIRAGLHPELSGIENVYFFGALLGLRPREIALHVDEIVAFAELEAAIDRQVKFYSSGMQMRLGFSVASFLDPAVLLVDEVLAVGDSAFQQRCLERMRDLLGAGTTLVFVSHDLAAVEATCSRALWLHDGRVQADGPTHDVLHEYREALEQGSVSDTSGPVVLSRASVTGADRSPVRSDGPATVELAIECHRATWGLVCIGVSEDPAAPIFVLRRDLPLDQGAAVVRCSIEHVPLPGGSYWLWVGMFDRSGTALMAWHPASRFDVAGPALDVAPPAIVRRAPVYVAASWTVG